MNKIKVIDLLNMISKGEEVPKKIIAGSEECEYFYDSEVRDYRNVKTKEKLFEDEIEQYIKYYLNDIVEIIEEPQEHKIPKKLNTWYGIKPVNLDSPSTFKDNAKYIDYNTEMFFDKINEILDYLEVNND